MYVCLSDVPTSFLQFYDNPNVSKVDLRVKLVSETRSTAIGIETLYLELKEGINMSASYFKKGSLVTIPINFRHNDTSLTRFN